ncbi:MAG: hypothetical protein Q4D07_06945 [Selenomonadaceae bacterium]|nr:hypothetical protein [Selenomonadaceae bacterium]
MYYQTEAELVVRVPIFVEADSKAEADLKQDAYIKTKEFRNFCKKQITANQKSTCVVETYNDHCTKEATEPEVYILNATAGWPII